MASPLSPAETRSLAGIKTSLTKLVKSLKSQILLADQFRTPWDYPENLEEQHAYITSNTKKVEKVIEQLETSKQKMTETQEKGTVLAFSFESGENVEKSTFTIDQIEAHTAEHEIELYLEQADEAIKALEQRLIELIGQKEVVMDAIHFQRRETDDDRSSTRQFEPKTEQPSHSSIKTQPQVSAPNPAPVQPMTPAANIFGSPFTSYATPQAQPQIAYNGLGQPIRTNNAYSNPIITPMAPQSYKEIKVPTFYGNIGDYQTFAEVFTEIVDRNPSLSTIEKLSYLLSATKGEAYQAIAVYPLRAENYQLALARLGKLYGDQRTQTTLLNQSLDSVPKATMDVRSLRSTMNQVQALLQRLKISGETIDTNRLKTLVGNKFPHAIRKEVHRQEYQNGNKYTIEQYLKSLEDEILLEIDGHTTIEPSVEQTVLHSKTYNKETRDFCPACKKDNHTIDKCFQYKDVRDKRDRIQYLMLCFKCFSPNHTASRCKAKNCDYCQQPHNSLICTTRYDKRMDRSASRHRGLSRDRIYSRDGSRGSDRERRRSYSRNRDHYQGRSKSRSGSAHRRSYEKKRDRSYSRDSRHSSQQRGRSYQRRRSASRQPRRDSRQPYRSSSRGSNGSGRRVNLTTIETRDNPTPSVESGTTVNQLFANTENQARMKLIPLRLLSRPNEILYGLLDGCSQASFIKKETAERLRLPMEKIDKNMTIISFGGHKETRPSKLVKAVFQTVKDEAYRMELLTIDSITTPIETEPVSHEDLAYLLKNGVDTSSIEQVTGNTIEPDILIGLNYYDEITTVNQPSFRLNNGTFAKPSLFGYTLSGSATNTARDTRVFNTAVRTLTAKVEFQDLNQTWELEAIGIKDPVTQKEEDEKVMDHFKKTVKIIDGKVIVEFPFKENISKLGDNYPLAMCRLKSLFHSKSKDQKLWSTYCDLIETQLANGVVEDVTSTPVPENKPVYYIPHQPVFKESSSTTKVRIVYDASSHMKGEISLNQTVYQGPLLLPHLLGVLLRARTDRYILLSDVATAYHCIGLGEDSRDTVRFLWLKNPNLPPDEKGNLKILRFTRIPFGVSSSSFLLSYSVRYFMEQTGDPIGTKIVRNLYVDDLAVSVRSEKELQQMYQKSKTTFLQFGLRFRKYMTNSKACNRIIDPDDMSTDKEQKILGVPWDPEKDTLKIKINLEIEGKITKRTVMHTVHKTFDPLGFAAPLLVKMKIFLQQLWIDKQDWDSQLNDMKAAEWKAIVKEIDKVSIVVPRMLIEANKTKSARLEVFVDASTRAYSSCVYLLVEDLDGKKTCNLVISKFRLTPVKTLTNDKGISMPRLELTALLIGTRLADFVLEHIDLEIKGVNIYSDSMIALHWLHSTKKLDTFVSNRCNEIKETNMKWQSQKISSTYHHIETAENSADASTRGLSFEELKASNWLKGPQFLTDSSVEKKPSPDFHLPIEIPETEPAVVTLITKAEEPAIDLTELIDNATSWNQLKIDTALRLYPELKNETGNLVTAVEMDEAETALLKSMQKDLTKESEKQYRNLGLFRDSNGVIRCRGRFGQSNLPIATQNPILLLPKTKITNLIIMDVHRNCGHQGQAGSLSNLRMKYWLPRGRLNITKCLSKCLDCQRQTKSAYYYPEMGDLPTQRITECSYPFQHIGIDYCGFFTITDYINDQKVIHKKWIALMTCCATRMTHLAVVNDLTTETFINALRRFCARRGRCETILSDRATTFMLAKDILTAEGKSETISDLPSIPGVRKFLATNHIKWKVLTSRAAFRGGFWERLMQILKLTLRKIHVFKAINSETFETLVAEIEGYMNQRPITYMSNEYDDSVFQIRPIDFVSPRINLALDNRDEDLSSIGDDYYPTALNTKQRAVEQIKLTNAYLTQLWKTWLHHYLLELRAHHQARMKQTRYTKKLPEINEIVLITDDRFDRNQYKMGRIVKLIPSSDGVVRTAAVSCSNGKHLERAICHLIPLELEPGDIPPEIRQIPLTPRINTDKPVSINHNPETVVSTRPDLDNPGTQQECDKQQARREFKDRKAKKNVRYVFNTRVAESETRTQKTPRWTLLDPKKVLFALTILTYVMSSNGLKTHCISGGVFVTDIRPESQIQICDETECFVLDDPQENATFKFNLETTMRDYRVYGKQFDGVTENTTTAFCPATDICLAITCTWCLDTLGNVDCMPRGAIAIVCSILFSLTVTIVCLFKCVRQLVRAAIFACLHPLDCIIAVLQKCQDRKKKDDDDNYPLLEIRTTGSKGWAKTKPKSMLKLVAIIMCISLTLACQDTQITQATISKCDENKTNCHNYETLVLNLNSVRPESCIQIKNQEEITSQMKLTFKSLDLVCTKESLFYTESREAREMTVQICPGLSGSCLAANMCRTIASNSSIPELDEVNNQTGTTYCGSMKSICLLFKPACLFYRIYFPEPKIPDPFEIYRCSSFQARLNLGYELLLTNKTTINGTVELLPNVPYEVDGHTLTMETISTVQSPMLNHLFATNDKLTGMLNGFQSFQFVCKSLVNGTLQGCTARDTCRCNPIPYSANCYCNNNAVDLDVKNVLPIITPEGKLMVKNDRLTFETNTASATISVKMDTTVNRTQLFVHTDLCNVSVEAVDGCYDCRHGAEVRLNCTSLRKASMGSVKCSSQAFALICHKRGFVNFIHFVANHANLNEKCKITCGSTTSNFEIAGTLRYVNGVRPFQELYNNVIAIRSGYDNSTSFWGKLSSLELRGLKWPDFGPLWMTVLNFMGFSTTALIITVILICVALLILGVATAVTSGKASPTAAALNATPPGMIILIVLRVLRATFKLTIRLIQVIVIPVKLLIKLLIKTISKLTERF